jgi:Chaperonin 10 Kd subunit
MQVGANVVYGRYSGTKVKIGDEEHILLSESDVLGVKGNSVADLKPTEVRAVQPQLPLPRALCLLSHTVPSEACAGSRPRSKVADLHTTVHSRAWRSHVRLAWPK